jgi:hypothetical protein
MHSLRINLLARTLGALILATVLGLGSCAHDANSGLNIVPYPDEVRIAWSVRGNQFSPEYWYYTVFNLSRSPSVSQLDRPLDEISNENRAENWELYVGFHPGSGSTELFTKQIPTGPTVIGTADGPSCTTTFDADGNAYGDIAVTCAEGGVTQLVRAIAVQENLLLPIYFRPVETINTGIRPWRCHNYDYNTDSNRDVVVLDQGNAATPPFIRVLTGDGAAGFTALANQPLGSDVLIDSVMDEFNNDTIGDLAVLSSNAAGTAWSLTVYLGNADGTFTAGAPIDAGSNALSLQSGFITTGIDSIVVADEGTGGSDGAVRVFDVAVDATLTARLEIPIPGRVFSAGFGNMFGSNQDIVACWQDGTTGQGRAGVFITDPDGVTATTPVQFSTLNNIPTYIIATETGNNQNTDVVLVMGDPDNLDQLLYIQEGGRFVPDSGTITSEFAWVNDTISYLSGLQPTRIEVAHVDVNGKLDLVVPNSSTQESGNSISLYYGLGKNNYTTAERYWTDSLPALLGSTTQWYVSAQFTNNQFELIIDPNVFYDQALQRPDNMVVQFFTSDRGINLTDNQDQLGQVLDKLNDPVNIPMEVGFYTDEQINPLARTNQYSDADADVDDWQIQVN